MQTSISLQDSTPRNHPVAPSLRDGLITLGGLTIATGSFFNREITLWWLGI